MKIDAPFIKSDQIAKARTLRSLHRVPPLLLPNAWDVTSARLFASAGYAAVGTSSGAIAWSLGYPDGEALPRDEMLAAIARIARAVALPVTADIESGYGATPDAVADTVRCAVAAGAVGINLEDHRAGALLAPQAAALRIRAARDAAEALDIPLVINARIDVYLHGDVPAEDRFDETVRRAHAYALAGADCVFPIGVSDAPTLAALAAAVGVPMNVWAHPGMPGRDELGLLGVARVSMAVGPYLVAMSALREMAATVQAHGRFDTLTPTLSYPDLQALSAGSI